MNLIPYINSLGPDARRLLEEGVGTSIGYLRKAHSARQRLGAAICVAIERESGSVVTRRELRPDDWWLIWPELITDEFPIPTSATEENATS